MRNVYGRYHKPPSQAGRIFLISILTMIVVVAFVWTTYDPKTFRLLSGARPDAVQKQQSSEPKSVDAKSRSGLDDQRIPR